MPIKKYECIYESDVCNATTLRACAEKVALEFHKNILFKSMLRSQLIIPVDGKENYVQVSKDVSTNDSQLYYYIQPNTGSCAVVLTGHLQFNSITITESGTYEAEYKRFKLSISYVETEQGVEVLSSQGCTLSDAGGVLWCITPTVKYLNLYKFGSYPVNYNYSSKFKDASQSNGFTTFSVGLTNYEFPNQDSIVVSDVFLGVDKLDGLKNIQFKSGVSTSKLINIDGMGEYARQGGNCCWIKTI